MSPTEGPPHTLARAYLAAENHSDAAWQRYAQALLLANAFVFVD